MTWSDPIVDEVRRAREAYAARFNFDLRAIYLDLKEQEIRGGRKVVSYAEDAPAVEPDKPPHKLPPAAENRENQVNIQASTAERI